MKRIIFALGVAALCLMVSCNKDTQTDREALAKRAAALGYDCPEDYLDDVARQCATGCHANCHFLDDGTHTPCIYPEHEGQHRNGQHHNGSGYGDNCIGNGGECDGSGHHGNGDHGNGHHGNH